MDGDIKTVHITENLSSVVIMDLLEKYPNLELITCPPSIYNRTSSNYIEALNQLDIDVKKQYNWGASKQSCDYEDELLRLAGEGYSAKEIASKLNITQNRVYYLLRRNNEKLNNYNKKHNHEEVKRLKDEGLKAKEISKKLDIPLRSVYYILNKK